MFLKVKIDCDNHLNYLSYLIHLIKNKPTAAQGLDNSLYGSGLAYTHLNEVVVWKMPLVLKLKGVKPANQDASVKYNPISNRDEYKII